MKIITLLLVLTGLLSAPGIVGATEDGLRFGVVPYLTPSRMDDIYSPVSRELSESLRRQVKFRTSSTMPRFKKNLAEADYDFALVVPILYPNVIDKLGYIPLVRMEESIHSLVVVTEDSPLQSINDLVGKTVGTPPVNGPVVLLAKQYFSDAGMAPETDMSFRPNKTVGACMKNLLVKKIDACIVPTFALPPFEKNMGVTLRTLLRTKGVPDRALVVHPRVPQLLRDRIKVTMLSWRDSAEGRALLRSMNTDGFVEIDDREYDVIRTLLKAPGD